MKGFEEAVEFVLAHEGGYGNDPRDPEVRPTLASASVRTLTLILRHLQKTMQKQFTARTIGISYHLTSLILLLPLCLIVLLTLALAALYDYSKRLVGWMTMVIGGISLRLLYTLLVRKKP